MRAKKWGWKNCLHTVVLSLRHVHRLWWECQMVRVATGDSGNWWDRQLMRVATGENGNWWEWQLVRVATSESGNWWEWQLVRVANGENGNWWEWQLVKVATTGESDNKDQLRLYWSQKRASEVQKKRRKYKAREKVADSHSRSGAYIWSRWILNSNIDT